LEQFEGNLDPQVDSGAFLSGTIFDVPRAPDQTTFSRLGCANDSCVPKHCLGERNWKSLPSATEAPMGLFRTPVYGIDCLCHEIPDRILVTSPKVEFVPKILKIAQKRSEYHPPANDLATNITPLWYLIDHKHKDITPYL
jgi:hypothetical protein